MNPIIRKFSMLPSHFVKRYLTVLDKQKRLGLPYWNKQYEGEETEHGRNNKIWQLKFQMRYENKGHKMYFKIDKNNLEHNTNTRKCTAATVWKLALVVSANEKIIEIIIENA